MFFKRQSREIDFLLFCLGNPGPRYAGTRHNAGWWLHALLLEQNESSRHYTRHRALVDEIQIGDKRVALIKPTTFMNLSGESVRAWHREQPDAGLAVVYDDFALEAGKVRVREKGSAGGHNGMKSIIECLGTNEIQRVRIGVGDPGDGDISDYVLSAPSEGELQQIKASLKIAARCCEELVMGSPGRAQLAASGQELALKKVRPPRPERPTPKLSMADLLQGRLRPAEDAPRDTDDHESGQDGEKGAD